MPANDDAPETRWALMKIDDRRTDIVDTYLEAVPRWGRTSARVPPNENTNHWNSRRTNMRDTSLVELKGAAASVAAYLWEQEESTS